MSNVKTTKHEPVILYSTSWCGYCKMMEQYLKDKGVDFVEKDIEADPEAQQELMKKINNDFRGVPVTDVNGTIVLGFDRAAVDHALAA